MSASSCEHRLEQLPELGGVVLAVAVEPHREPEAVLERVAEAGLHGAADPEVERQADHVRAALLRATAAVRSTEPSSTTTISSSGSKARISSITRAMLSSSLNAGTIAIRRSAGEPRVARRGAASATSATNGLRNADAEQLEQPPRAVQVRVLVECALARRAAQLLGAARVVEQLAVRRDGLVGVSRRPAARVPARTSARSPRAGWRRSSRRTSRARTAARWTTRRRSRARARVTLRLIRAAEIARAKTLNGTSPTTRAPADVAAEVLAAEREVDLGEPPARLADHRLHPLLRGTCRRSRRRRRRSPSRPAAAGRARDRRPRRPPPRGARRARAAARARPPSSRRRGRTRPGRRRSSS